MKPDQSGAGNPESGVRGQESEARGLGSARDSLTPDSWSLTPQPDDPRLIQAVHEYVRAREAGQSVGREEFLGRHAAIAGPLAECLEALEFVTTVGPRLDEALADCAAAPAMSDIATPLGDFRLVREIGRGGMGVVYEAEQLSLGRRIALKVLPFALTLDPRQLQRFKTEARAAAHLHHSNIVPIYSVGCERGVHFYAMQYIDGQPLSAVIVELRRLAGPGGMAGRPDNQPTGPYLPSAVERPETFVDAATTPRTAGTTFPSASGPAFFQAVAQFGFQAAEALEHAHQRGVVHRDVKPGNLLLDITGHLWVADFGLAQFPSDAALTMTGDLVGTLRYMSPEQALARRGLVDHRTDLYSLGATLYELLTLVPAFDGQDRQELLRQIALDEPRPPRQRNRAIPVDLETIVLKAMAKRVEDRYATAQELADDLRRFLDQKPIRARRPAPWERAAKWSRRHRAITTAAVAFLLLASIGFAISTLLIAREQRATATQRDLAEANFRQARQMLDFLAQVSEEELADQPAVQDIRRKLLEAALEYYESFIEQHGHDPSVREELVASHLRVANLLQEIGARADAVAAALHQARQVQQTLVRDRPTDPEYLKGLRAIDQGLRQLRNRSHLRFLVQPAVQKELELSHEQRQQVAELVDKRREAVRDPRNANDEEWRAQLEELAEQEHRLEQQLSPQQHRRLEEIELQQLGPAALASPAVIATLGLTDGQVEQIEAILGDPPRPPRGGPRPGGRHPDGSRRPEEFRTTLWERLHNMLTAEQKEAWNRLIGEPFAVEIPPGPAWDYAFRPARGLRKPPPMRGRPGD
ncbi:MAG TPA: protein kinase [Gemmataceae bacterium]|nr:protein kinase [Gemmataceae bacterium]